MSHVVTGKSSASMYSCTRGRSRPKWSISPSSPNTSAKGIATAMLRHAVATARAAGFHLLEIGTGDLGVGQIALYERCGFVRCGIDVDYFSKHYPVPFFENGVECRHMVRLRMELK